MSTNNVYYVDMEKRFDSFKNGIIDMRTLHHLVYDEDNVALAVRQLNHSPGKMAFGPDGTNYKTLENYSIVELAAIVKDRLLNKTMSYVRRTYIAKDKKKTKFRPLGICSIWDKLVEKCIQLVLDPYCETKFVDSSFGFREQVSTHNAMAKVKNQCQTMPYVLSLDLENYFGTLDADIMYREMWHIGIKDQVILNYIYRFIKKGYYEDSCKVEDPKGAAQGSILGPLVANIYLHRFDVWLRDQGDRWHDSSVKKFHNPKARRRNMEITNLKVGIHVRYADDILVLCKDISDAEKFKYSITQYLTRNMRLIINEDKTKIYDLTREKMKYLGYDFYASAYKTKSVTLKGKVKVANTLPEAKANEIAERCRELLRNIRKKPGLETFNDWNVYVVGIHNYYRGMTHFCVSFRSIGWRIRKLFYHTMKKRAKFTDGQKFKDDFLNGRYSSWGKNGYYCFNGFPIVEIGWANWDKNLIAGKKGRVIRENPYSYGEKKHKPGVTMEAISYLVNTSKFIKNSRLAMFRISKYSSVKGASYLSGAFVPVDEYHCHHIKPIEKGGTHDFYNLCVLSETEHRILHSNTPERLYDMYPKRKKRIKALIDAL